MLRTGADVNLVSTDPPGSFHIIWFETALGSGYQDSLLAEISDRRIAHARQTLRLKAAKRYHVHTVGSSQRYLAGRHDHKPCKARALFVLDLIAQGL